MTAFTSCNGDKTKETCDSNSTQIIDGDSLIKGVWWDDDNKSAIHASYFIQDSIFYYFGKKDAFKYKYQIIHDSIAIIKEDGNVSMSKILMLKNDTLILILGGKKRTFLRSPVTVNWEN